MVGQVPRRYIAARRGLRGGSRGVDLWFDSRSSATYYEYLLCGMFPKED